MESEKNPLVRSTANRVIAGVCGGLAEHFDVDTRLVRAIFVALLFASGFGFWLYIALWLILPTDEKKPDPPSYE